MPFSVYLLWGYRGTKYRETNLKSQQAVPEQKTEPKCSDSWSFDLKQATGKQSSVVPLIYK